MGDKIICDFITRKERDVYLRTQWVKPWGQPKKKIEYEIGKCSTQMEEAIRKNGYYDMLYKPEEDYFIEQSVINRTKHYFNGKFK
jgi:hypothetical protein